MPTAEKLSDLAWFARVVEQSELTLNGIPDDQLSTWFVELYAPERKCGTVGLGDGT